MLYGVAGFLRNDISEFSMAILEFRIVHLHSDKLNHFLESILSIPTL